MWKDFFEGLARLRESGKPFVVATVVKVSGSTYRRPGARVLITEDGVSTGLISGGCFESDLIERAKRVMQTQEPSVATFDTTSPTIYCSALDSVAPVLRKFFSNHSMLPVQTVIWILLHDPFLKEKKGYWQQFFA